MELARAGLLYPNTWAELCTLRMAAHLVHGSKSKSLGDLATHFGLDASCLQLHRAEVDCDLLIGVVDAMLGRCFGQGNHLLQVCGWGWRGGMHARSDLCMCVTCAYV